MKTYHNYLDRLYDECCTTGVIPRLLDAEKNIHQQGALESILKIISF